MKNHFWNMFANIRNGCKSKKSFVYQRRKKNCKIILNLLWDEGFIIGYKELNFNKDWLKIFLKYDNKSEPCINKLTLVTKPGRRIYYSKKQICKIDSKENLIIFSTNKGVKKVSCCKRLKLGGEPLLIVN